MANMVSTLNKELASLLVRIGQLQKQAESLRDTIQYFESKESDSSPAAQRQPRAGSGRPRKDPNEEPSPLVCGIINILRASGPLHYRDIYEKLKSTGVTVSGEDPARNMAAHLSLNKGFFKSLGSGHWGLAEWVIEQKPSETRLDESDLIAAEEAFLKCRATNNGD